MKLLLCLLISFPILTTIGQGFDYQVLNQLNVQRNTQLDGAMIFMSESANPLSLIAPVTSFGMGVLTGSKPKKLKGNLYCTNDGCKWISNPSRKVFDRPTSALYNLLCNKQNIKWRKPFLSKRTYIERLRNRNRHYTIISKVVYRRSYIRLGNGGRLFQNAYRRALSK